MYDHSGVDGARGACPQESRKIAGRTDTERATPRRSRAYRSASRILDSLPVARLNLCRPALRCFPGLASSVVTRSTVVNVSYSQDHAGARTDVKFGELPDFLSGKSLTKPNKQLTCNLSTSQNLTQCCS
jgi:hypothetical protein